MKHVLLLSLLCICMLSVNSQFAAVNTNMPDHLLYGNNNEEATDITLQPGQDNEKMLAVIFRSQEFCRIELKDFEWQVEFNIVSATVYFSGTNFKNVEKGTITSKSLKPVRKFMDRCVPGSMVIFDNVKVMGPDKMIRSIAGTSYLLH